MSPQTDVRRPVSPYRSSAAKRGEPSVAAPSASTRRLRRTSRGEIIVALPRPWLQNHGLEAGERVSWSDMPTGDLVLSRTSVGDRSLALELTVAQGASPELLFRRLVAAYLSGATEIILRLPTGSSVELRRGIQELARRTARLEIINERGTTIVLRDVSPGAAPTMPQLLRRLTQVVRGMLEEAGRSWAVEPATAMVSLGDTDDESDRLTWRIERGLVLHLLGSGNSHSTEAPTDLLFLLLIARAMERIGDHAVRMGEEGARLTQARLPPQVVRTVTDLHAQVLSLFDRVVTLIEDPEADTASQIIDGADGVHRSRTALMDQLLVQRKVPVSPPSLLVPVSLILESIDRSAAYVADIAEVALDRDAQRHLKVRPSSASLSLTATPAVV